MKKWIAALSFLLLAQMLCAQAGNNITRQKIDSLLRTIYSDSLPGISIGIVQNNALFFEHSYGVRDIKAKTPITANTNFNIASLTKQFTALAILQLSEQKKLSLTDKISLFFPDMNKKVADRITIQQLLTHTSGLYDHYNYVNTKGLQHGYNRDVYNAIKNLDSLYFISGSRFRYSNTGYCLLALVIEKISGISYNDYIKKYIFHPAGMKNTLVWNETATVSNEAKGYDKDSATGNFILSGPDEHIFFSTEGDGGIYTSIHDYLLWLKALNEGNVFSKKIVEQARTLHFVIQSEQKIGYGFGWFVDESAAHKIVYHSGDNGGFRTYSFTIPGEGFAIVIFSNRSDISVEDIAENIYHVLYPARSSFIKIEILTS